MPIRRSCGCIGAGSSYRCGSRPPTNPMRVGKTVYAKNRKQWRSWLAKHHGNAREIWLIYYKKSSGKPRIPYNDAVEEALCYGWIDSILKPIDDQQYAQR